MISLTLESVWINKTPTISPITSAAPTAPATNILRPGFEFEVDDEDPAKLGMSLETLEIGDKTEFARFLKCTERA